MSLKAPRVVRGRSYVSEASFGGYINPHGGTGGGSRAGNSARGVSVDGGLGLGDDGAASDLAARLQVGSGAAGGDGWIVVAVVLVG
jgi:hypothetical protein